MSVKHHGTSGWWSLAVFLWFLDSGADQTMTFPSHCQGYWGTSLFSLMNRSKPDLYQTFLNSLLFPQRHNGGSSSLSCSLSVLIVLACFAEDNKNNNVSAQNQKIWTYELWLAQVSCYALYQETLLNYIKRARFLSKHSWLEMHLGPPPPKKKKNYTRWWLRIFGKNNIMWFYLSTNLDAVEIVELVCKTSALFQTKHKLWVSSP